MAGDSTISKIATEFGFTIHDLLRYAFTGTVALLIFSIALIPSQNPAGYVEQLKVVASLFGIGGITLLALSLDVVIYIATRQTLGTIVASVFFMLRWWFGSRWRFRNHVIFDACALSFGDCEVAFFVLRTHEEKTKGEQESKPLWSRAIQEQLFRQHSESHLIFSTALVCLVAGCFSSARGGPWTIPLLCAFVIFTICGMFHDAALFQREGTLLAKVGDVRIREILTAVGMLGESGKPTNTPAGPSGQCAE